MFLSQNIKDDGIYNVTLTDVIDVHDNMSFMNNNSFKNNKKYLGSYSFKNQKNKIGKVITKPSFTAYNKTNFGSIPNKVENKIIKLANTNIIKQSKRLNTKFTFVDLDSDPGTSSLHSLNNLNTEYSSLDIQKSNDMSKNFIFKSFNKRGFGNGFISKTNRFTSSNSKYSPSPCDYSTEKYNTIYENIKKSNFGKSFFNKKVFCSLLDINNLSPGPCTYFQNTDINDKKTQNRFNTIEKNKFQIIYPHSIMGNIKESIQRYKNNLNNKNDKFNFGSTTKRFSVFKEGSNKSPSPGSYFTDTSYKIKEPNKLSPEFIESIPIRNDKLKLLEILKNRQKNKSNNFSKASNMNNTFASQNSPNLSRITLTETKNSSSFVDIAKAKLKLHAKAIKEKEKILMEIEMAKFKTIKKEKIKHKNKNEPNKQKQSSPPKNYKMCDKNNLISIFERTSNRWDDGKYKNNDSHFQPPGPAYYKPKILDKKLSFNSNKFEFIITKNKPLDKSNY